MNKNFTCRQFRITASSFRRTAGEYLVVVEQSYKAKLLNYRWKP